MSPFLFEDAQEIFSASENHLSEKAQSILKNLINDDSESVVKEVVKKSNLLIREHLRQETGLRISDDQERTIVPIEVSDFFPTRLARLLDIYGDLALWLLVTMKPRLNFSRNVLEDLLKNWNLFSVFLDIPFPSDTAKGCVKITSSLLKILNEVEKAKKIIDGLKLIDEDILGVYSTNNRRIGIFWKAIALIAPIINSSVESLTVVVLAHELAHAYTHIGRDIDGQAWPTEGFIKSETDVVEGIAQYYTELITIKLSTRFPGAHSAFKSLLALQPDPYHFHSLWFKEGEIRRQEVVRFTLLLSRKKSIVTGDFWLKTLEQVKKELYKTM